MSSIVENRAYLQNTGRSIHFRDCSWKKTKNTKIYRGFARDGIIGEMQCVCLKVPVDEIWDENDCNEEIKKYERIQDLANEFNSNQLLEKKIEVIVPEKAVIDRIAAVHNMKGRRRSLSRDEWIIAFPKLANRLDVYVKRNGQPTVKSSAELEAFVHFCYHATNGQIIVTKLRGVRRRDRFTLSCPAVIDDQSKIKTVLANHQCNEICQGYLRYQNSDQPQIPLSSEVSRVIPSAPLPEDPDSDDDVFYPEGTSKASQSILYELQRDARNQFYAIPHSVPYDDFSYNVETWNQFPDLEPPPYSSHCPEGHRVEIPGLQRDFNANENTKFCQVLWRGDSAYVQQSYLQNDGLL